MQPYNIQIDPALAREAQAVFSDLGINLSAAVTVLRFPVPVFVFISLIMIPPAPAVL